MEKPRVLYHGSTEKNILEFEPKVARGGEKWGPLVYATDDKAIASIFTSQTGEPQILGRFREIPCFITSQSEKDFIKYDRGGCIYELPSETFESSAHRGFGPFEWTSPVSVKPINKTEYESALQAMHENGVKVYFVDKETFDEIQKNPKGFKPQ